MLPENKKVNRDATSNLKVWVYGQPNIGKTTFANQFPDALMLNTDGNYKGVDSPVVPITDWEQFVKVVEEILEGKHEFKSIVIDLVEDVYVYCKNYYCTKLKIDHEADLGYGKGYDIIKTAFLIVLRKLANSPYNLLCLSHEKETVVKDRIGRETTIYKPNISDGTAIKISGMMEITGRLFAETDKDEDGETTETRKLFFGSASDMFTGNKVKGLNVDSIIMDEVEGYNTLINSIKGKTTPKIEITTKKPKIETNEDKNVKEDNVPNFIKQEENSLKIERKNK